MCSLLMTDEAHSYLNGLDNKHNFRYQGGENLRILNVKELHPQRVTACVVRDYVRLHYWQKALQKQSIEKDIETYSIHS